jgi:hypothetical protein
MILRTRRRILVKKLFEYTHDKANLSFRENGISTYDFKQMLVKAHIPGILGNPSTDPLPEIDQISDLIKYCREDGYITSETSYENLKVSSQGEKFISWWYPLFFASKHYIVSVILSALITIVITYLLRDLKV